jgi:hypothetical protein
MGDIKYKMSFTTGGLFHNESLKFVELYLECGDWNAVSDIVKTKNTLQARTESTLKRTSSELIARLKTLNFNELDIMMRLSPQDQRYLLWLSTCRRYQFIADFAVEILRERYLCLKTDLNYVDFDAFFNQKAEWHNELDNIKPTTKIKLRQVLFKILREADLLSKGNTIKTAIMSPQLFKLLSVSDLQCLPTFDDSTTK